MFMFFSYNKIISPFFFFFLLLLSFIGPSFPARTLTELSANSVIPSTTLTGTNSINYTWHNFTCLIDTQKGSHVTGISYLKKYLNRFGYLEGNLTDDKFDDEFEAAVTLYQKTMGLSVTGKLDSVTVTEIMSPRCGVSDSNHNHHVMTKQHFAYFNGMPRWDKPTPMTLTYAFSPGYMIQYIDFTVIQGVFERSFSRWSAVIPVNFTEVDYYDWPDIKIGFYSSDHGDGEPFDGVLGVLAHAFSPENGRFHMDAGETWAVDFQLEKSKVAVDLESVATHEIGHVLGLGHSSLKKAVMYPSLKPRTKKVDLREDDVAGIQSLYGSNPNYKASALSASDTFSSRAAGLEFCKWVILLGFGMLTIFFCF